jgi:transposase
MLVFIRQEPTIEVFYDLVQRFGSMGRTRQPEQLDPWLKAALGSGIPDLRTFAEGLQREYSSLKAALTYPYNTGPVEGQINQLNLNARVPRKRQYDLQLFIIAWLYLLRCLIAWRSRA